MSVTDSPKFQIGDLLYIRESAALGYLEPVKIRTILKNSGGWLYTIAAGLPAATVPQIYGDRRLLVNGATLYVDEHELLSYCDALRLAVANAQANLNKLMALQTSACNN